MLGVNGTGCADFDYNHDPCTDPCLVNGSTIANLLNPGAVKDPPHNYLFRNNGDGTFTDVTRQAGVEGGGWGNGAVAADYNNDGWVDLFVYNFGKNILYRNNGDGTFTEIGTTAGIAYNGHGVEQSNMGLAIGDIDNDGWMDLFVTTFADDNYTLFHNDGRGFFTDITYPAGVGEPTIPFLGWAAFFIDSNNDGWK